jgi:hypothetical protein
MKASTSSRRKRISLPILTEGILGSFDVAWSLHPVDGDVKPGGNLARC